MYKLEEYKWINENSKAFLNNKSGYLLEGETITDRFEKIANTLEKYLWEGYAEDFLLYLKEGFYALSTPFISNVGRNNALPFSCSNQHIGDSLGEIYFAQGETAMLTKMGMGTSGYVGLRGKGEAISDSHTPSPGSVHFAKGFDQLISDVNQGVRRGYMALYWDAYHPDILDVLDIQRDKSDIKDINYGVCISDAFMEAAKTGGVKERKILAKIHESRFETGMPYIFFTDNVNATKPDVYKDNNLKINSSNLCTEILEVSNDDYSFVCDIAAMNAMMIDNKNFGHAVQILTYGLDALHTIFQNKIEVWRDSLDKEDKLKYFFLQKAYKSSVDFRDIGVGCTGYHSLLQSKMFPFESMEAKLENAKIFKTIQSNVDFASKHLATIFGEPTMLKGYGRRNCLTTAVAPNTSSAFILGQVSQGIEPIWANYYVKDIAKLKTVVKNKQLEEYLSSIDKNTEEVWNLIAKNDGSVQNLPFLSEEVKKVFKTFREISPMEVVTQAVQRQKFIDQSQSLNLMIDEKVSVKDINTLFYWAWKMGIKTLYYQHSVNAAQQLRKSILECESCSG